jgi:heme-degrading monooxygenase HmoA
LPHQESDKNLVTHINVFTVSPENQQQLVDVLVEAAQCTIRKFPGYISSYYHKSLDGTKVTTYAQWRSQADFEAMLQSPETAQELGALSQLATSFEPHLYEVVFVDEAVAECGFPFRLASSRRTEKEEGTRRTASWL